MKGLKGALAATGAAAATDTESRERQALAYLREKINQLLQIMGTLPLRPEELDDETLFAIDPLGIIGESFAQVLEHLQQTNAELALARDEVRAIFDAVGAAILVVDREGRIQTCNRRSYELFFPQLSAAAGVPCHIAVCRQPAPPPPPNCVLRRLLAAGGGPVEGEFAMGDRHFHVVANPLGGECGQVALVYTDMTQRRRTEQSLQETQKRLRTIVGSVQAGILLIDAEDHHIVEANDKALEMIGAGREEVVGAVCSEFICSATCGECPITDLGQTLDNAERWLLSARGEQIPVLKTVTAVELDGRRHLLESFIDLRARKQAEQALQESERKYRSLYTNTYQAPGRQE